jgi:hypothetical protein
MLLGLDGGLDDEGVEGVGNERDDQVVLADLLLKRIGVRDVEGDGAGVLETLGEGFGAVKGTAGCWGLVCVRRSRRCEHEVRLKVIVIDRQCLLTNSDLDTGLVELDGSRPGDEAGTEEKNLVDHDCGLLCEWVLIDRRPKDHE